MSKVQIIQKIVGAIMGILFLIGCNLMSTSTLPTLTPELPTNTPKPLATATDIVTETPTPVPTPTIIPSADAPINIDASQLQIVSVDFGPAMLAPVGMAADETVLTIELKVLSGDPEIVSKADGEFDVWITNETGRKNSSRAATATITGDGEIRTIQWLFGIAEDSESLYLHFPNGVTVDLTPLLS